MITVYGRTTSINVQKVMWCCAEVGVEVERIDVGGEFGGTHDPAFVARNPNATVPVLQDGDFTVWEIELDRALPRRGLRPRPFLSGRG